MLRIIQHKNYIISKYTRTLESKVKLLLTKQAVVPLSLLHCSSKDNMVPGRTRTRRSFSCGKLNKQVAVSPLELLKYLVNIIQHNNN